jgi:hypothetical protein
MKVFKKEPSENEPFSRVDGNEGLIHLDLFKFGEPRM